MENPGSTSWADFFRENLNLFFKTYFNPWIFIWIVSALLVTCLGAPILWVLVPLCLMSIGQIIESILEMPMASAYMENDKTVNFGYEKPARRSPPAVATHGEETVFLNQLINYLPQNNSFQAWFDEQGIQIINRLLEDVWTRYNLSPAFKPTAITANLSKNKLALFNFVVDDSNPEVTAMEFDILFKTRDIRARLGRWIPIGLDKLSCSAKVRVSIGPFVFTSDMVHRIEFMLREPPKLHYKMSGVLTVLNLPFIMKPLVLTLQTISRLWIVYPQMYSVELTDYTVKPLVPLGLFKIQLRGLRNVPICWHGNLKVYLGSILVHQFEVKDSNFDESFELPITEEDSKKFIYIQENDSPGEALIDMTNACYLMRTNNWTKFIDSNGKEIDVSTEFHPVADESEAQAEGEGIVSILIEVVKNLRPFRVKKQMRKSFRPRFGLQVPDHQMTYTTIGPCQEKHTTDHPFLLHINNTKAEQVSLSLYHIDLTDDKELFVTRSLRLSTQPFPNLDQILMGTITLGPNELDGTRRTIEVDQTAYFSITFKGKIFKLA